MIEVSALKGTGRRGAARARVPRERSARAQVPPEGSGVRASCSKPRSSEGKGIVAHLLVQDGTLKRGDVILAGEGYGKVRSMHDDRGNAVDERAARRCRSRSRASRRCRASARRSTSSSDLAQAQGSRRGARAQEPRDVARPSAARSRPRSLMQAVADQTTPDDQPDRARRRAGLGRGAASSALASSSTTRSRSRCSSPASGTVTENDVNLAGDARTRSIIAFHVGVNDKARAAAERCGVEIRYYEVIYELLDDMRELMEGTLAPEMAEEVTGHVEVRALFKSLEGRHIAGCHVHRRLDLPRQQGARAARRQGRSTPASSPRCAARRTTPRKSARASTAASSLQGLPGRAGRRRDRGLQGRSRSSARSATTGSSAQPGPATATAPRSRHGQPAHDRALEARIHERAAYCLAVRDQRSARELHHDHAGRAVDRPRRAARSTTRCSAARATRARPRTCSSRARGLHPAPGRARARDAAHAAPDAGPTTSRWSSAADIDKLIREARERDRAINPTRRRRRDVDEPPSRRRSTPASVARAATKPTTSLAGEDEDRDESTGSATMLRYLFGEIFAEGTASHAEARRHAPPTSRCRTTTARRCASSDFRGQRVVLWFYPKADTPG